MDKIKDDILKFVAKKKTTDYKTLHFTLRYSYPTLYKYVAELKKDGCVTTLKLKLIDINITKKGSDLAGLL